MNEYGELRDGTYWILKYDRNGDAFACKMEWKEGVSRMREVFHAAAEWHLQDNTFTIPKSYKPYMHKQHYTILRERGVAWPDGWYTDFFGARGVELIDHERRGLYPKAKYDVVWKTPTLGTFSDMRFPE